MKSGASGAVAPIREREFHAWLARHLPAGRGGLLPLGDDAAAIRATPGRVAVLTTDALVEGTHFLRESPPERVGAAATGVSLSDLAAKGAAPAALLLAIIVPRGTPTAWARAVVAGAEKLARAHGAEIVGGDTKPGPVRAVVSTALGWGVPDHLAARTMARPGDLLATTGVVGRGGLAADHFRTARRPGRRILSDLLDVRPRVQEGSRLVAWAHAMLDTSDGLAEAAHLLSAASRARVVVEEERLPLAPGIGRRNRSTMERRATAFYGGDYELLTSLRPRDFVPAQRAVRARGGRLTRIGYVERGRGAWLLTRAGPIPMPRGGWQPFETTPGSRRGPGRSRHRPAGREDPSQGRRSVK
jgi:thiamine-monophosphate kinase